MTDRMVTLKMPRSKCWDKRSVWKRNLHTLLVRLYIGTATMENSMEIPQKIKIRTTI